MDAWGETDSENNLIYQGQSRALNEHLSDVFGIMLKQSIKKETVKDSNWLIGEELMIGEDYALRSMKSPGTAYLSHPVFGDDTQPDSMDKFLETEDDNGGVHINSGIPNKAFYLACQKLYQYDSEKYAFAWKGAGQVWYDANNKKNLSPTASFIDFANSTIKSAESLFGKESDVWKAVRYAWSDVNVLKAPTVEKKFCDKCSIL